MKKTFFLFMSIIVLLSCKNNGTNFEGGATNNATAVMEVSKAMSPQDMADRDGIDDDSKQKGKNSQSPNPTVDKTKQIIKDGSLSIKSQNLNESKKIIDSMVVKWNAYYEHDRFENNDNQSTFHLKIRIPSSNFESFLSALDNGTDEIIDKNIQARDVTEEYQDIQSRLSTKTEYLKRYRDLLSKAKTIKEILEIEEIIRNLQEEIDSFTGRLKYLSDQVTYSSIDIRLYQIKEYVFKPNPQDHFLERIKKSISTGWHSIREVFLVMISLWPFIILVGVIVFFVKRRRS